MIIKNKQFKIERKRLVINREPKCVKEQAKLKKFDQKKQNVQENQFKRSASVLKISANILQKRMYSENLEKSSEDIKDGNIHLIGRNPPLQKLIHQLLQKLKQRKTVFKVQINSYIIEKQFFVNMIEYLISLFTTREKEECNRLFRKMNDLKQTYSLICQYSQLAKKIQKQTPLCLNSCTINFQFTRQCYKLSVDKAMNLTQHYREMKAKLQENIHSLNSFKLAKQRINNQLTLQISQQLMRLEELRLQVASLQSQKVQLANSIDLKEQQMINLVQSVKEKQSFIYHNREVITNTSKEYKQAQIDLYQFSRDLLTMPLAAQLIQGFAQIQNVSSEYSHLILKELPNGTPGMGVAKIKEFADRLMTLYRKEFEVWKLQEVKSKCILKFRQISEKWMRNWSIKQGFLMNMRSEFYIQNEKMLEGLDELKRCHQWFRPTVLSKVKQTYFKIKENYIAGNSFY